MIQDQFSKNENIMNDNIINMDSRTGMQPGMFRKSMKRRLFDNMMLIVTDKCNLRCSYCYASGHNNADSMVMTWETAKKAVDIFFSQVHPSAEATSITFFGGEPLIAFDLIKKVIDYSYNHPTIGGYNGEMFNYVINTNGTVFNEEIYELFKRLGKKLNLRISLDGYKDIHDITRKTIDGKGSWSMLEKNLSLYKDLADNYGVKIGIVNTINKANCRSIYDNHTKIYELTGMTIGYLFVHEEQWTEEDFNIIKEQVSNLHDYCVENKVGLSICNIHGDRHPGLSDGEGFESACSACISSFTVDPKGNFHPCHRCYFNRLGDAYVIGNVDEGINESRRSFMYEVNNMDMLPQKCRTCNPVIRDRCHICFATNKKVYGDLHHIPSDYCIFQKDLYYILDDKEFKAAESARRMK